MRSKMKCVINTKKKIENQYIFKKRKTFLFLFFQNTQYHYLCKCLLVANLNIL